MKVDKRVIWPLMVALAGKKICTTLDTFLNSFFPERLIKIKNRK